jgi:hypothetical protein
VGAFLRKPDKLIQEQEEAAARAVEAGQPPVPKDPADHLYEVGTFSQVGCGWGLWGGGQAVGTFSQVGRGWGLGGVGQAVGALSHVVLGQQAWAGRQGGAALKLQAQGSGGPVQPQYSSGMCA